MVNTNQAIRRNGGLVIYKSVRKQGKLAMNAEKNWILPFEVFISSYELCFVRNAQKKQIISANIARGIKTSF